MRYAIHYKNGTTLRKSTHMANTEEEAVAELKSQIKNALIIKIVEIEDSTSIEDPTNKNTTTTPPTSAIHLSNASIEKLAQAITSKQSNQVNKKNKVVIDEIDLTIGGWFKVILKASIAAIPVYFIFGLIAVVVANAIS